MVKNISIANFKSIKRLDFEASRINIFLGEPNSGKSNLLEALGMFSLAHDEQLPIRFKEVSDLFFDHHVSEAISVRADNYVYRIPYNSYPLSVKAEMKKDDRMLSFFTYQLESKILNPSSDVDKTFKYYQFKVLDTFPNKYDSFLHPPFGDNLFHLLFTNKELKSLIADLLNDKGYRLGLRSKGNEIEIVKEEDNILYAYPYQSLSDTLQRMIFYTSVVETNQDSVILLEEPESNVFPYYTKFLAEKIAADQRNQYFLVTHNPYFLMALVEKTALSDLSVFITYTEDYQTKLKKLTEQDLSDLLDLDMDVFLNLDKFIASEDIS